MEFNKLYIIVTILSLCWITDLIAQNWYKGNLHTHTLWSDGDTYPEIVIDWYKNSGYDFISLTDHNIIQKGEAWKIISNNDSKKIFETYLTRYGENWVNYERIREDSIRVRLKTLEECQNLFNKENGFIILPGLEITSNNNGVPVHINAINIKNIVPHPIGNNTVNIIKESMELVEEQRKVTGEKMFTFLNHPNFGFAVTANDIINVQNVRFFELFNGGRHTNNYGDADHDSAEIIWDKVNLHNLKTGRSLMLGIASDDSHTFHLYDNNLNIPGRAWVMVNSSKLELDLIIDALEDGNFYSTTGVILEELNYESDKISLKIKQSKGVTYKIQFIGVREDMNESVMLQESIGNEANYIFTDKDLLVRVKIISTKPILNPFRPNDVETAWTQPIKVFNGKLMNPTEYKQNE